LNCHTSAKREKAEEVSFSVKVDDNDEGEVIEGVTQSIDVGSLMDPHFHHEVAIQTAVSYRVTITTASGQCQALSYVPSHCYYCQSPMWTERIAVNLCCSLIIAMIPLLFEINNKREELFFFNQ
jgi:hypothetical protein